MHLTQINVGNVQLALPMWNDDQKRQMLTMGLDFMAEFKELENTHKAEWRFDVGKQAREASGASANYLRAVVEKNRQLYLLYPAPVPPTTVAVLATWENNHKLRLADGDRGFMSWANAEAAFVTRVLAMLAEKDLATAASYRQRLPHGVIVFS